jgi:predicted permease
VYQQLVPIIAPVVIAVLLGFGWERRRLPFDRDFLTTLVMYVGVPCLILDGILGITTSPAVFLGMVGNAIVVLVACGIVGAIALRALGQPLRSYLPPIAFGNSGPRAWGLPSASTWWGPSRSSSSGRCSRAGSRCGGRC